MHPLIKSHMVSSLRPPIPLSVLHALATYPVAFRLPDPPRSVASFERHPLHCNRMALCKGVLRARISRDMTPCCDHSSCPRDGSDGKPIGRNTRMDCEQLFLFGLSRFLPFRCELRGHSTALSRFPSRGTRHCLMLSDLLSEAVLKQGPRKEVSLTMTLLVFSWRLRVIT